MTSNKPSVTIPLMEGIEACSAVIGHVSKDDVTPLLTRAQLKGDRLIGTDRYTVGTFRLSTKIEGQILIPRTALDWVARINPRTLVGYYSGMPVEMYELRITGPADDAVGPKLLGESVVVEVVRAGEPERMQKFKPLKGDFPPVTRLLDEHKKGTEVVGVNLNPVFIERVTKYAHKWHRNEPVNFLAGASENLEKPGVVRVSIGKFEGLIQPNLLRP